MIKNEYVIDCLDYHVICTGCGKSSKEDPAMIRVKINYPWSRGVEFYLCNKCRMEMYKTI